MWCVNYLSMSNRKHLDTKNEKTNTLSWIFRVLQNVVHWNNSLWVDTCMSFHSETLFWLDQFLFLLLNAALLPIL